MQCEDRLYRLNNIRAQLVLTLCSGSCLFGLLPHHCGVVSDVYGIIGFIIVQNISNVVVRTFYCAKHPSLVETYLVKMDK